MLKENELNYHNEKHNCILHNTKAENWPETIGHGNKTEIS